MSRKLSGCVNKDGGQDSEETGGVSTSTESEQGPSPPEPNPKPKPRYQGGDAPSPPVVRSPTADPDAGILDTPSLNAKAWPKDDSSSAALPKPRRVLENEAQGGQERRRISMTLRQLAKGFFLGKSFTDSLCAVQKVPCLTLCTLGLRIELSTTRVAKSFMGSPRGLEAFP
eukprot:gene9478-3033_t